MTGIALGSGGLQLGPRPGGGVEPFDPAIDIAPEFWWLAEPAHVVQSGGLVDRLVNVGSGGATADFVQVGAARAPLATDGDGDTYLALDGVADFYQSVAAGALWQFLCTGPYTMCLVVHRLPGIAAGESVLDLISGTTANSGCTLGLYVAPNPQSGTFGPVSFIGNGNAGTLVASVVTAAPRTGKEVWTLGYGGRNAAPVAQSRCTDMWLRRNASLACESQRATVLADAAAVSAALTLGRHASSATAFTSTRIYEALVVPRMLTDRQVMGFEEYARLKYELPI